MCPINPDSLTGHSPQGQRPPVVLAGSSNFRGAMTVRRFPSLALACLLAFALPAPVLAAEESLARSGPAVSAPNGKLSAFGGASERDKASQDGLGGLTGSWSAPLGDAYGVQLDGLYGLRDGDIIGGAGVNLFWRDPGRGLLGLTGSWVGWDADKSRGGYTDIFRFGGAGEVYFERFTLAGQAGGQFGENTDDGFYGRADLKWYPTPDLALRLGGEYNEHSAGVGRLGLEFQPGFKAIPGLTVFADGAVGEDDYYRVFAGLRIYFGSAKSLKDRHRRDDPENTLADNASLLGRGSVSAPPPPPPEPEKPSPPESEKPSPPEREKPSPPEREKPSPRKPEECVPPKIRFTSGICGIPPTIT